MSGLAAEHIEKILRGDMKAGEDYSERMVCLARAGGQIETLNCTEARALLARVQQAVCFSEATVLVNRTTENYGVLTVQSAFAPFLSYACIVQGEKITGATLYIYQPSERIVHAGTPMPKSKPASKMFYKHVRAMFSVSAKVITKDYAESGVVITNMTGDVCEGKGQIYAFCDHLMKNCWTLIRKMNFHGISSVRWKLRSAGEGLLLFTIEAPKMGMVMTESYWIEDGKIQFECSIAHGAMLDLVHELLD